MLTSTSSTQTYNMSQYPTLLQQSLQAQQQTGTAFTSDFGVLSEVRLFNFDADDYSVLQSMQKDSST